MAKRVPREKNGLHEPIFLQMKRLVIKKYLWLWIGLWVHLFIPYHSISNIIIIFIYILPMPNQCYYMDHISLWFHMRWSYLVFSEKNGLNSLFTKKQLRGIHLHIHLCMIRICYAFDDMFDALYPSGVFLV